MIRLRSWGKSNGYWHIGIYRDGAPIDVYAGRSYLGLIRRIIGDLQRGYL